MTNDLKPLYFIGSSRDDISVLPDDVKVTFGQALFEAQCGEKHSKAKVMKGFGGAGVLEVVERHDGDTFRAVYAVKFAGAVYVLHAFQKKAKRGIATPQADINLIKQRLKAAEDHWKEQNR